MGGATVNKLEVENEDGMDYLSTPSIVDIVLSEY